MSDRTLVFIGDSITDAGRTADPALPLGAGYVRFVADQLAAERWRVVNTGISGHRAIDLLARWQHDALDHGPEVLSIYVGINDTWRRFDSDDPTSVEDFEDRYRSLLDLARSAGVPSLVLVEPFVLPAVDEQRAWIEDLDPKREVVSRLADEFGAVFVPLQEAMAEAAERDGVAAIAPDGVHPADAGARLIAERWLDTTRAAGLI